MFLQAATSKCCILSDGTARTGLSQPLRAVRHMLGGRSRPCVGQHQALLIGALWKTESTVRKGSTPCRVHPW